MIIILVKIIAEFAFAVMETEENMSDWERVFSAKTVDDAITNALVGFTDNK